MAKYLFSLHASVNSKFEAKSMEHIIIACGNLNAIYYDRDKQVYKALNDPNFQYELLNSLQTAGPEIFLKLIVNNLPVRIKIIKNDNNFKVSLRDYTMDTLNAYTQTEDTIPSVRLLLRLLDSFVIKKILLLSEYQLFPHSVGTNVIAGYVLIECNQKAVDRLIRVADNTNYLFIASDKSEKPLGYDEISSQVLIALREESDRELFIKVKDSISILRIGRAISIVPQMPYRMKTAGDESGVDLAFYTEILLTLAEPFGMDEMEANFE